MGAEPISVKVKRFIEWCLKFLWSKLGNISILTLIASLTIYFGGFEKVQIYYNNYKAQTSIKFSDKDFGILICYFDGEDEYKKYASKDIVNTLNGRFHDLNINAVAKHDAYIFVKHSILSHDEANLLGQKYNADLVIWGSVSKEGTLPNIRIVDGSKQFKSYQNKEFTIFKESLQNVANDKSFKSINYAGRRPCPFGKPAYLDDTRNGKVQQASVLEIRHIKRVMGGFPYNSREANETDWQKVPRSFSAGSPGIRRD